MPPKSILKNSKSSETTAQAREDHNRQTALHYANLIQYRKDVEAQILEATISLLDHPSSLTTDPYHPSPEDIMSAKRCLNLFTPQDYDGLIEERNIDHKCGYIFCTRPPNKENTKGKFRIITGRGRSGDLKVVPTKQLERWCSEECGKRALYVRVQLSEEPAWLRGGEDIEQEHSFEDDGYEVKFMDEPEPNSDDEIPSSLPELQKRLQKLTLRNETTQQLALERGNLPQKGLYRDMIMAQVKERLDLKPPDQPMVTSGNDHSIEGYVPKNPFGMPSIKDKAEDRDIIPSI
ncbi:MAG: hypothetical protein M1834_003888 [Cirrosporium novae-zelandiae]|nr:MAG: hypothetical protein M1834_003888 [Cirrosporium novae-zelandiae]